MITHNAQSGQEMIENIIMWAILPDNFTDVQSFHGSYHNVLEDGASSDFASWYPIFEWVVMTLTHWSPKKMVDILQTTFSNASLIESKMLCIDSFPWSLCLRIQFMISLHCQGNELANLRCQAIHETYHDRAPWCTYTRPQWPLLLTWFNFNPSMDK